jgi:hypothetical protein
MAITFYTAALSECAYAPTIHLKDSNVLDSTSTVEVLPTIPQMMIQPVAPKATCTSFYVLFCERLQAVGICGPMRRRRPT